MSNYSVIYCSTDLALFYGCFCNLAKLSAIKGDIRGDRNARVLELVSFRNVYFNRCRSACMWRQVQGNTLWRRLPMIGQRQLDAGLNLPVKEVRHAHL